MVYFRKRLLESLGELNELLLTAQNADDDNSDNASNDDGRGAMIVDATCAPSQLKYPQDSAPLNEAQHPVDI